MKLFLLPFSSLPLIQEGLVLVTSESMCTKYWYKRLFKLVQEKGWLGDMTIAVDWNVKHQTKQKH